MHIIQIELQVHAPVRQVSWKIIYVYLGEFLGPMQEVRMEFKHLGILARPETSRNLVLKFP